LLGSDIVGSLSAVDYKWVQSQQVNNNKLVAIGIQGNVIGRQDHNGPAGKGHTEEGDPMFTLNATDVHAPYTEGVGTLRANGGDLAGDSETIVVEQPIVFENSYRDSARIAENGVTQTLSAKMGTGGGNTPMVAFATNQRAEVRDLGDKAVALSAEPGINQQTYVAIPIQDGREMHKNQNGLGIGEAGAPAYTLVTTGAQSIAIGIQGNVIGRQDHNGPAGKGHTEEGDPMFTLNATDIHAVAYSFDSLASNSMKSNNPHSGVREVDVSKTLDTTRPDPSCNQGGIAIVAASLTAANDPSRSPQASEVTQQVAAVVEASMTVRRLTPIECERLMGWPDNWTAGQIDTHRYKQCGNGVASPVAEWIGRQLINLHQDTSLLL
jgi:DNA (cytosine-5)-methyltransferase 1